ncbi:ASST-domain-containing protein [Emericellopsis atlantica]|uniref:ASST-domain-containing protein n=1 Tax=Emericellopsis atlantica TaxID=2614577 RepID=A0A9P7ZPG2_9HYPO|nr:ASST-domain-containing protein [Emericellopsis atlantica]KAG9255288.1 ASST-domain-containing protein [Emericellopsis atlantica]
MFFVDFAPTTAAPPVTRLPREPPTRWLAIMGIPRLAAVSIAAASSLFTTPVSADKPYHTDHGSYQNGALGDIPTQSFHSSKVKAPVYQVNYWDPDKIDTDSPYMFMAGKYGKWGPSIVSSKDLSLVWADQSYNGLAQVARTWEDWNGHGRVMSSYSDGRVRVYDQNYKQLHVYDGRGDLNGVVPDSHEAALTNDGHILMFLCPARDADLSKVGGPAEGKRIGDCTIQEIVPDTAEVVFEWATSDFFRPEDSVWKYNNEDVWDYCHMNAVEKTEEGNYLISYRQLSCVVLVNGQTKEVMWVMGGKRNTFKDITQNGTGEFGYQHEARMTGKNRFTLFDNHKSDANGWCTEGQCSRGLEIEYNPETMEYWKVNEWYHPQNLISASRGGVQRTPSGNVIVAWGQNPMYTEYTADGELIMDIQRADVKSMEHGVFDVITYRIWKGQWEGNPSWGPSIACAPDDTGRSVYVSWNGATKVDHWVLLMSDDKKDLNGASKVAAQSPRNGFETQFQLDGIAIADYARVAALDKDGNIIGSTPAVDTKTFEVVELDYDIDEVKSVGSKTIDLAIPSSAKVTVPANTKSSDDKDDDKDDDKNTESEAYSSNGPSPWFDLLVGGVGFFVVGPAAFL